MRTTIQALVEGAKGEEPRAEAIGVVEREADSALALGLGTDRQLVAVAAQRLDALALGLDFLDQQFHLCELAQALGARTVLAAPRAQQLEPEPLDE